MEDIREFIESKKEEITEKINKKEKKQAKPLRKKHVEGKTDRNKDTVFKGQQFGKVPEQVAGIFSDRELSSTDEYPTDLEPKEIHVKPIIKPKKEKIEDNIIITEKSNNEIEIVNNKPEEPVITTVVMNNCEVNLDINLSENFYKSLSIGGNIKYNLRINI